MKRRLFLIIASSSVILGLAGCTGLNGLTTRSQSPDPEPEVEQKGTLIGDFAVPTGTHTVQIESIALVTGLHGTGSDPSPSPERAALLEEMRTRGVSSPDSVLESGDVALVKVMGWLRPGIQKGDSFDVEVRVLSRDDGTTSLRGGYLLETRLSEKAIMGNQVHSGKLLAKAMGPVMVDPMADAKKDRVTACRGRVLGGGVSHESRKLGLVLTPENKSVFLSSKIANAINKRFHIYENGHKSGVAKAKTDELIELSIHPRYKDNYSRFLKVVAALPITESETERMERLKSAEQNLFNPEAAADAAIQLEAAGNEGVAALLKGIATKDPEIRFYAAEALAYLDHREAAEPLGQIARDQPAFRVYALTALSTMQDYAAYEQLRSLLTLPSAETRYGAFRALWAMNKNDAFIRGESFGGQFTYHVLAVDGPAMIHVTSSRLPEIVVFGPQQELSTPFALNAGNEIMVTGSGKEVSVSRYTVKDGDQKRIVSPRVDEIIRAVVELGGSYPDVVQALQEAKNAGSLASRFEVDALPQGLRVYDRVAEAEDAGEAEATASDSDDGSDLKKPSSPIPELFAARSSNLDVKKQTSQESDDEETEEEPPKKKGLFTKWFGRK